MTLKAKVIAGVALAAGVALVVAGNLARRAQGGAAVRVQVLPVAAGTLEDAVEAEGEVEPVERVEVRAPAAGSLARVLVDEGDRVEQGQALAVYDEEGLRQARDEAVSQEAAARARVAQLEARLNLERELRAADVAHAEERLRAAEAALAAGAPGAEEEVAAAQAALEEARRALAEAGRGEALEEQLAAARAALTVAAAAARRAEADLGAATVRAPVSGVVLSREGTRAGPVPRGAVLFVLADTGSVVVRAKVDEVDIGGVQVGAEAAVTHPAFPGRTFPGRVERVAPQARREARAAGQSNVITFDVRVVVDNREGLLRPGMSVDVRLVSARRTGVLKVPVEAVVERDGRRGVFVLEGQVVRFVPVTTGLATRTEVEVTAGLRAGQQVVVGSPEALKRLADGRRARPEGGGGR